LNSPEGHITIAVDAMGGDYAPAVVVEGAVDAVTEGNGRFSVMLVGRREVLDVEFRRLGHRATHQRDAGILSVAHAPETIAMNDPPTTALRTKKQSSIVVGLQRHREGDAQAFVSAGNTGAVLSASTLILGRIKGVGRPTIGALIPTAGTSCLLVDAGANVDCRPRHLLEFGIMGSAYISAMLNRERPTVGLLSIGEEDAKGNETTLEAFSLLKESSLNFVGNIEGRDLLRGTVDVAVCDGFVGNILLKFGESVPGFLKSRLTRYASGGLWNKVSLLIARNGMRAALKDLDYQEHGGVPLLGVNGVSIIGHGRSTPRAIKNMILRADETHARRVNQRIQDTLHATAHRSA
jgi:glycerol-3-phosphate acyltransferase PlsX